MMSFLIREIDLSKKKDLNAFVDLPWTIYKDDPYWVAPLKMAVKDLLNFKHPFYKTANVKAWLAEENGKPVGRIMAIQNHTYNKFLATNVGHFGWFESINDSLVAKALVDTAAAHLKSLGLTTMLGPMNPGTNYECGILVDHFNDYPQIMMTHNPEYYEKLLTDLGFTKAMDLLAYNISPSVVLPQVIYDIAAKTESRLNVSYRSVDLKNWKNELDIMFDIYNSAWEANWGFVPMSKEEFAHTAKDLKSIVDPSLIHFAMVNGVEAGFILTLLDLNQIFRQIPSGKLSLTAIYKLLTAKKRINRARVLMMGIKKEFRKKGLETLMYRNMQVALKKNPRLLNLEMSWILETNSEMTKPLVRMAGPPYKTYRLLEKAI